MRASRTHNEAPRSIRRARGVGRFFVGAAALAVLSAPAVVGAQAIEGSVWEVRSDRRVGSALIRLVDATGAGVSSTQADSTGRFRLPLPEPGTYRLHAERTGYEPWERSLDIASATETRTVEVNLRPAAVEIRGIEVTADQFNRRLRTLLGIDPSRLRVRPVSEPLLREYAARGNRLPDLMRSLQIPSMEVLRGADGAPCYQFRRRGCLPVYVDGTRLSRSNPLGWSLDGLGTVVVVLPNEAIAYPDGAVHLYSVGYVR